MLLLHLQVVLFLNNSSNGLAIMTSSATQAAENIFSEVSHFRKRFLHPHSKVKVDALRIFLRHFFVGNKHLQSTLKIVLRLFENVIVSHGESLEVFFHGLGSPLVNVRGNLRGRVRLKPVTQHITDYGHAKVQ